jgi:hypothetical protein
VPLTDNLVIQIDSPEGKHLAKLFGGLGPLDHVVNSVDPLMLFAANDSFIPKMGIDERSRDFFRDLLISLRTKPEARHIMVSAVGR